MQLLSEAKSFVSQNGVLLDRASYVGNNRF